MKKRFVYFSLLVIAVFLVNPCLMQGQQTTKPSDPYEHFRQAKFFFESNNFTAAQEEFRYYLKVLQSDRALFISERASVEYYIAMCSIYSMRPEAELQAVKFIADHPESPYTAKLITEIGVFFYETGDWNRAIKYLLNSAQTNLEHKYYLAISYYKSSQFKEALALFNLLKYETEEEFALPAAYYAGVMHFNAARYEEAIEDFKTAIADPKYAAEAPVWISSAYMKLNRYNDLIAYVEPILRDSTNKQPIGNLALIIAELQFQKQDFPNAAKSYSVVSEKSPKLMSRENRFKYAFALYKAGRLNDALAILGQPSKSQDSLDQEMVKTRALILIDQEKWDLAYQSLRQVAEMPYNKDLADDAYLMYLNLLQKNQQWPVLLKELKAYQKRYPQNKHSELVVSLAVEALKKQASFSAMEDFMLNFPIGKVKFQELYQSSCYQLATAAYDKLEDKKATIYFKKSLDFAVNREMAWNARYGLAEILSRSNKNSDAIKIYMPLLAETSLPTGSRELSQRLRLSLAYSFAFITMYDRSLPYFEAYVANKLGQRSVDDLRNLAEISIAKGSLEAGLKYFDEAIQLNTAQSTSILERKAAILTNLRLFNQAANVYQDYINKYPNDAQVDLIFYRMNEALVRMQKTEQYAQIIKNTSQFIHQKSPNNPYYAPVLLIRAQAFENTNQWFLAMDDYITIVRKFTADSSAKEAIIGASDLLKKAGRLTDVLELQRLYASQHGDDPSLAEQWFDISTEMFRLGKYKLVVPELVRFMQAYPSYAQSDELNYMLGISTFHTKDYTNSLTYLKRSQQGVSFSNQAQFVIALIYEEQKRTDLAISQLVDLKANVSYQDTLMYAVQDKLKLIYGKERKFDKLTQLYNDLDQSEDSTRLSQWSLEIGLYAQDAQDYALAKLWFEKALATNREETGAKASLGIAKSMTLLKDYQVSNEWLVSQFIKPESPFYHLPDSIVGLAYLLMADNFIYLKNIPQARAILQSIMTSSSDDTMKMLAKKKMEEIQ